MSSLEPKKSMEHKMPQFEGKSVKSEKEAQEPAEEEEFVFALPEPSKQGRKPKKQEQYKEEIKEMEHQLAAIWSGATCPRPNSARRRLK